MFDYNGSMKIEEVIINHYKSIKDPIHLRDFSEFHILVGPNNAGKTNILDAIHIFFDKNVEEERFFDKNADIKITLTDNEEKHVINLKGGKLSNHSQIDAQKNFIRINDKVDYFSVVKELKFFKTSFPEEYLNFSQALEKYFTGIEINEELFLHNVQADQKSRSVKRMGEGFKRLFVILFYIFHPNYKIILIDEPETHLHPSIIKKFLRILKEGRFGNQVLFTTHHPSFVQARYLPYVWRITRNKNNSTALYGFNGKNLDLSRFVQEINDDNSGILFASKALLVEGVSDAIFMREMINRFYKKETDIKVVYTSGKGSVDIYAELCEIFNIPYAIMLDNDALNSTSLQRVRKFPKFKRKTSLKEKKEALKEKEIFVLERDLEHTYPLRYKKKETKPLAALHISQKITENDLKSKKMKTIKELLEKI